LGIFSVAQQELKKSALKALFKLKKDMGSFFNHDITLTLKLFDALVKPILLYSSEVWGIENMKIGNPIESVHIKFCKMLLGVRKTATNSACLAELGQLPMHLEAKLRTIRFWLNITKPWNSHKLSAFVYGESLTFW